MENGKHLTPGVAKHLSNQCQPAICLCHQDRTNSHWYATTGAAFFLQNKSHAARYRCLSQAHLKVKRIRVILRRELPLYFDHTIPSMACSFHCQSDDLMKSYVKLGQH